MPIIKTLLSSVPFDAYLLMTVLSLLHLSLPAPMVSFTGIIANGNAFMAMLMLGVGFKMTLDKSRMGKIIQILFIRYSVSIALAAAFYFLLPFELEYRQALAILALSPIASAAPAFTGDLEDVYKRQRHPFDQFIIAKTPAGRWGEAEDLGGPAVFLASEASNFVNGLVLYVDGGILAYIGKQPK